MAAKSDPQDSMLLSAITDERAVMLAAAQELVLARVLWDKSLVSTAKERKNAFRVAARHLGVKITFARRVLLRVREQFFAHVRQGDLSTEEQRQAAAPWLRLLLQHLPHSEEAEVTAVPEQTTMPEISQTDQLMDSFARFLERSRGPLTGDSPWGDLANEVGYPETKLRKMWRALRGLLLEQWALLGRAGDVVGTVPPTAQLSPAGWRCLDAVLLWEVPPESSDLLCDGKIPYDHLRPLITLFHLVQTHRAELGAGEGEGRRRRGQGEGSAWRRVHEDYTAQGRTQSLVGLQWRWALLCAAAAAELRRFWRQCMKMGMEPMELRWPPPLFIALVKRYPHIATDSDKESWASRVAEGRVYTGSDALDEPSRSTASSDSPLSPEDNDDVITLVEREIETIDLDNDMPEGDSATDVDALDKDSILDDFLTVDPTQAEVRLIFDSDSDSENDNDNHKDDVNFEPNHTKDDESQVMIKEDIDELKKALHADIGLSEDTSRHSIKPTVTEKGIAQATLGNDSDSIADKIKDLKTALINDINSIARIGVDVNPDAVCQSSHAEVNSCNGGESRNTGRRLFLEIDPLQQEGTNQFRVIDNHEKGKSESSSQDKSLQDDDLTDSINTILRDCLPVPARLAAGTSKGLLDSPNISPFLTNRYKSILPYDNNTKKCISTKETCVNTTVESVKESEHVSAREVLRHKPAIEQTMPPRGVLVDIGQESEAVKSESQPSPKRMRIAPDPEIAKYLKYTPSQLENNPDFNTRLKGLSSAFLKNPWNRQLLRTCRPVTVDVVRGIQRQEGPAGPQKCEKSEGRSPQRVRLRTLDDVRRINAGLRTAQVPPLVGTKPNTQETVIVDSSSGDSDAGTETAAPADKAPERALTATQLKQALLVLSHPPKCKPVAYCCVARRHRAVNDARRRLALSNRRKYAGDKPLHRHASGECWCCCLHLLDVSAPEEQAQRLAEELQLLLRSPAPEEEEDQEEAPPFVPRAAKTSSVKPSKSDNNQREPSKKKKSTKKRKKKSDRKEPKTKTADESGPIYDYLMWIKERNLASQVYGIKPPRPRAAPPAPRTPSPPAAEFREIENTQRNDTETVSVEETVSSEMPPENPAHSNKNCIEPSPLLVVPPVATYGNRKKENTVFPPLPTLAPPAPTTKSKTDKPSRLIKFTVKFKASSAPDAPSAPPAPSAPEASIRGSPDKTGQMVATGGAQEKSTVDEVVVLSDSDDETNAIQFNAEEPRAPLPLVANARAMHVAKWLKGATGIALPLLQVSIREPILRLGSTGVVVSTVPPPRPVYEGRRSYILWALRPPRPPVPLRLPSGERVLTRGQTYQKVQKDPPLYAQILFVLSSIREVRTLLKDGVQLYLLSSANSSLDQLRVMSTGLPERSGTTFTLNSAGNRKALTRLVHLLKSSVASDLRGSKSSDLQEDQVQKELRVLRHMETLSELGRLPHLVANGTFAPNTTSAPASPAAPGSPEKEPQAFPTENEDEDNEQALEMTTTTPSAPASPAVPGSPEKDPLAFPTEIEQALEMTVTPEKGENYQKTSDSVEEVSDDHDDVVIEAEEAEDEFDRLVMDMKGEDSCSEEVWDISRD